MGIAQALGWFGPRTSEKERVTAQAVETVAARGNAQIRSPWSVLESKAPLDLRVAELIRNSFTWVCT